MKRLVYRLSLVIITCSFSVSPAQPQSDTEAPQQKTSSFVALPYAYYTPETKFAFGVGSVYSFRPPDSQSEERPSNVKIAVTFTQKKQVILALVPELYFKNESYFFYGWFTYYRYPDKFWGIGNNAPDDAEENYSQDYFRTFVNFQKRFLPGLYFGGRYQFEHIKLRDTDENGLLHAGTVPGSESGRGLASGFGFIATYDTRDNVYYPSRGRYYQLYGVYFSDALGSDYRFDSYTLDLREYHSIMSGHILAFQSLNMFIRGTPPFQMMALIGGSYWMRGYFWGRYRDKNMMTFQTEYRFPLFWRFGGAGFAGAGDVANDISKFQMKEFKYSLGFGLRLMFDTREKINARLDFGFGADGEFGLYAMVVEAF